MADERQFSASLPRRSRGSDDPRMIGNWKLGRTIGKGSSGRVRIARHAKSGQYAAIKIVSKTTLINSRRSLVDLETEAERLLLGVEREIVIMKLMDHPNVMHLYDVWETSSELFLVLEYVEGGELFDYICDKGRLPPSEALLYFQQIISAVGYCHCFNVAHRDLKPENLLLDSHKNIKVADFGMAAWQDVSRGNLLQTSCGSPHYAAPEVVRGERYDGKASDIWSCGVILYALLAGRLPFDDENIVNLLEKVKIGKYSLPDDIPAGAKDLISRMLEQDVSKRITMSDILSHPWFLSQPSRSLDQDLISPVDASGPISTISDVDPDILSNMRTLWHSADDNQILSGLRSEEQTWEKCIYHLLLRYRMKHLENYNCDTDDLLERSGSKKVDSFHTSHVADREKQLTHDRVYERPAPPTPRRASGNSRPKKSRKDSETFSQLASSLKSPMTISSAEPSQNCRRLPPPNTGVPHPTPVTPANLVLETLKIPPIASPELVENEDLQTFFQQIVDHLQNMQQSPFDFDPPGSPFSITSPKLGRNDGAVSSQATTATHPTSHLPHNDLGASDEYLIVNKGDWEGTLSENSPSTGKREKGHGLGILSLKPTRTAPARYKKKLVRQEKENIPAGILINTRESITIHDISRMPISEGSPRHSKSRDKRVQIQLPQTPDRSLCRTPQLSEDCSSGYNDLSQIPHYSTGKTSWFNNLFKFKPASAKLLSTHNSDISRDECRRLLAGFGVQSTFESIDGVDILKCKLDEIRDPAGLMGVMKAVNFRVEISKPSDAQESMGYETVLLFVQEKGAHSSFKVILDRLHRDWDLDAISSNLVSPRIGSNAGIPLGLEFN